MAADRMQLPAASCPFLDQEAHIASLYEIEALGPFGDASLEQLPRRITPRCPRNDEVAIGGECIIGESHRGSVQRLADGALELAVSLGAGRGE